MCRGGRARGQLGEGGGLLGVVIIPGVLPAFPAGQFGSGTPVGLGLNPGSVRPCSFPVAPARRQ